MSSCRFACVALAAFTLLLSGCRRPRTIEIGWDVPATLPANYRIYVDEQFVRQIPPPTPDPSCRCLKAAVQIPPGEHKVRVDACNASGACSPSAELTAR